MVDYSEKISVCNECHNITVTDYLRGRSEERCPNGCAKKIVERSRFMYKIEEELKEKGYSFDIISEPDVNDATPQVKIKFYQTEKIFSTLPVGFEINAKSYYDYMDTYSIAYNIEVFKNFRKEKIKTELREIYKTFFDLVLWVNKLPNRW